MADTSTKTIVLGVEGMTCSSCVARVEKSLNELPGVSAAVNLALKSAKVEFPAAISEQQLLAQVKKLGYVATLPTLQGQIGSALPGDAVRHAGTVSLLVRLAISIALSIPVIVLAMVPAWQFTSWQWISLLLTTPVVFWCGLPFHRATFINLRHGTLTMDTLITMGTFAAYGWSVYALFFGAAGAENMHHEMELFAWQSDPTHNIYFEAAAGVTTFLLLGRYLEERSQRSAGAALRALGELKATEASVLTEGTEERIPAHNLVVGDMFVVRPGEIIATDGVIVDGFAAIDESALTGESLPVEMSAGMFVTGSTIVLDGRLVIRATLVGRNTRISQLAQLVEDAQLHKAAVQKLADKISAIFVPIVMGIALVTIVGWALTGLPITVGFTSAIAVLVIACPCALGLATPVALLVGTGRAAQLGIIISGPDAIESSSRIDTVVLDKTGTITSGSMSVSSIIVSGDQAGALRHIAALEAGSEHPIARAIVAHAAEVSSDPLPPVDGFRTAAGLGVSGIIEGTAVSVGNEIWMQNQCLKLGALQQEQLVRARAGGATAVLAGWNGHVQVIIVVADTIKTDSTVAVARMLALGLTPLLLTGDHEEAARNIAHQVGISRVVAGASPEDKVNLVKTLQSEGKRVAMVGDGVNDAAALAQADLGIAMGTGTDLAIAASDITLVRGTLSAAVDSLELSRRTLRIIHGNLFWAFAYNVAAIPLAAFGFLNPMIAGAAMAFSSLFVVLNSLRLRSFSR
jgi:P-type Cu+ transporter